MNDPAKIETHIGTLTAVFGFIFSTIVLLPISVIISGKLISSRIHSNFLSTDDHFSINLIALKIKSTGDQVAWGFAMFIMALAPVLIFGGQGAYKFFTERSGIDAGQWPALCAISGFLSVFISLLIWLAAPLFQSPPIIEKNERDSQITKLMKKKV